MFYFRYTFRIASYALILLGWFTWNQVARRVHRNSTPSQWKQHSHTATHTLWSTNAIHSHQKYERKASFLVFFSIFVLTFPKRTDMAKVWNELRHIRRMNGTVFEMNLPRCWRFSGIGLLKNGCHCPVSTVHCPPSESAENIFVFVRPNNGHEIWYTGVNKHTEVRMQVSTFFDVFFFYAR